MKPTLIKRRDNTGTYELNVGLVLSQPGVDDPILKYANIMFIIHLDYMRFNHDLIMSYYKVNNKMAPRN
jgi:hypothetical protein